MNLPQKIAKIAKKHAKPSWTRGKKGRKDKHSIKEKGKKGQTLHDALEHFHENCSR
jgi:hypothetical protein